MTCCQIFLPWQEFVSGFEYYVWHGIGAPVINKLNVEIDAVLADPKTKERSAEVGGTVIGGTTNFGKLIAGEIEKWGKVIRAANIKPEPRVALPNPLAPWPLYPR